MVEQLAGQQPELFTALLQGCQEMPLEPSGSPQEDFVAPFIYQLLPPDVANNVDNVLGPRPQHWSQRMGIPYLEELDRWLDETISDQPQVIAELIAMTVASGDPSALQSLALSLLRFYFPVSQLNLEEKDRMQLEEAFEHCWPLVVTGETELRWRAVVETLVRLAKCDPEAFARSLLRPPRELDDSESWPAVFGTEPSEQPPVPVLQTWLRRALPEQAETLWEELGRQRKLRHKLQRLVPRYDLDSQPFLLNFERYLSLQRVLDSPPVGQQSALSVEAWFERRRAWAGNSPLAFLRLLLRFLQVEIKELKTRALRTRLRFLSVTLQLAGNGPKPLSQALREHYPELYGFEPRQETLTSFERIRSLEVLKRFMEAHSWKSTAMLHQRLGPEFVAAMTCEELVPCWLEFVKDSPRWR